MTFVIGELEIGGTQRQMLELACALDPSDFMVDVVALSRSLEFRSAFELAGIPVSVEVKSGRFDVSILLRLSARFKQSDVIMTFGFTADLWARLAARLAGVPAVISSIRTSSEDSKLRDGINWCLSATADHYIGNSEAVMQYIRNMGVPRERMTLIPNGVHLERFDQVTDSKQSVRETLGIGHTKFVVGIVSRLSPEKNLKGFLTVAEAFSRIRPSSVFVIVGDGPEMELLRNSPFGRDKSVYWLGSRNDVPRVLKSFDVAVLTSMREGFSNAVLEYMAAGLPIVASDAGDNAKLIMQGKNGLIFRAGDDAGCLAALCQLSEDSALRSSLADCARMTVEQNFSTGALARKTADVFVRLLGRTPLQSTAGIREGG